MTLPLSNTLLTILWRNFNMQKLTRLEVGVITIEADRLMRNFPSLRLGQAIWTCADKELSKLPESLINKLYSLLDPDRATIYDFYHWTDYYKLWESFYERYVEQY